MFLVGGTLIISIVAAAAQCPLGGQIFERGISDEGKIEILNAHNNYRLKIANGNVQGQPRGVNLKRMVYDDVIGEKGRLVSNTCGMRHVYSTDNRWERVGQNLYISWSSERTLGQEWQRAFNSWVAEGRYFQYPARSWGVTGHYTQVVWAETDHVGCDFISFFDVTKPSTPYAKLYTCNYGPMGNFIGRAPYRIGKFGCENLC